MFGVRVAPSADQSWADVRGQWHTIERVSLVSPMGGALTFHHQARQYDDAAAKPGGVTYYWGPLGEGPNGATRWVDCLLRWDDAGQLVGIINHYPQDVPPYEVRGNLTLFVDPAHLREGIATELVLAAVERFGATLDGQSFTPDGLALAKSLRERGLA